MAINLLPLLDRHHFMSMTGHDEALGIEILGLFKEQCDRWKPLLNADGFMPEEWADAAHALKGSALGVGAMALANQCEEAERAGREVPPPKKTHAKVYLSEIHTLISTTEDEVAKLKYELETGRFKGTEN